jgi:c-di-GMP-binding flagellar brake protein YcgR
LTEKTHLVILPVEPGLGNLHLRYSTAIVLRMFTKDFAVEMATTFENLTKVQEIPVLRLAYPALARIVRKAREFRAKVIESLNFVVSLENGDEDSPELLATPVDISLSGMCFAVSKKEQKKFKINEPCWIKLYLDDELRVSLSGTIKHLSKIRKRSGIEYVCGIEFNLTTKTTAAVIESLVAAVQRAHLKELADKSEWSGVKLIP